MSAEERFEPERVVAALMPGTPPFDDLHDGALSVEIVAGIDAPVCSLEHLRRMKRASDRPRDAVDLAELNELHGPE